eukprot:m.9513 g.9513  ORF g.9513 m.9513 type:complete len:70 (+) comp4077_c0_seq1:23-232(+)
MKMRRAAKLLLGAVLLNAVAGNMDEALDEEFDDIEIEPEHVKVQTPQINPKERGDHPDLGFVLISFCHG